MAEDFTKSGSSITYVQPKDKKGHLIKDTITTEALEAALLDYRTACEEAQKAVREQLKALAATLEVKPLCSRIIAECTMSAFHSSLLHL